MKILKKKNLQLIKFLPQTTRWHLSVDMEPLSCRRRASKATCTASLQRQPSSVTRKTKTSRSQMVEPPLQQTSDNCLSRSGIQTISQFNFFWKEIIASCG